MDGSLVKIEIWNRISQSETPYGVAPRRIKRFNLKKFDFHTSSFYWDLHHKMPYENKRKFAIYFNLQQYLHTALINAHVFYSSLIRFGLR